VADDVRPLDPEVTHQRATVGRLLREADRASDAAAARASGTMVCERAVMARERRLVQQRREPIREISRMNQHDRLPGSSDLVLEFKALEGSSIHPPPCHARLLDIRL